MNPRPLTLDTVAKLLLRHSSLAEGVENAAIVCCFISSDYEQSENCQLELQYAHKQGRRVLLFMLCGTQSWKPTTWLESIMEDLERIEYYTEYESDIDYSARWLIYRINQKRPSTRNQRLPSAEQPNYLYELVKHDYRRKSRIERFINPFQSFSIEQSYINVALVETKEHSVKEKQLSGTGNNNSVMEKFEGIYGTKSRIEIKDIFKTCKNNEKKVLVFGRAGIGKSTFCRYVAFQWACGMIWSEYDLVALIPFRTLTEQHFPPLPAGTNYTIIDVLKKVCFGWNRCLSDRDEQLLQQQFHKSRILWLLDGYDEMVQPAPAHRQHLLDHLLETPHHIVTSRPYQNTLSYQVRMEIIGFTDENIPKYITQFFSQVDADSLSASVEEEKLLDFLKLNPRIWGIAHIPINLELICSVWSNTDWSETKAMTVTMLYETLSTWLCRRYLEKQRGISTNKINLMNQQEISDYCKNELSFLESLAFLGMERNAILLRPKLLAEASAESRSSLTTHEHLLNIGLLKSVDHHGTGTRILAEKDYYFVHLSFQEYFAARYLIKSLQSGSQQRAIKFIQRQKYNRRFTLLFRFASGLAVESNCGKTIESFWNAILGKPIDLIGIRHIQLVMSCFDEVLHRTDFPYQDRFLSWVQNWIEHAIISNNKALCDCLAETLSTCTSIVDQLITQHTFTCLLQVSDYWTKHRVLELLSTLEHLRPHRVLLCAILDQLKISDTTTKDRALQTLGSLGERVATSLIIDHLLFALEDESPDVKLRACEAVERIGKKVATTAVLGRLSIIALGDEDPLVRRSAVGTVISLGEEETISAMLEHLVISSEDENPCIRSGVWELIGIIGEKAATSAVLDRIIFALEDVNPHVRSSAWIAVACIGEEAATRTVLDRLIVALDDENPHVRSSACEAVECIGKKVATTAVLDRLIIALGDENCLISKRATEAFISLTKEEETISAMLDHFIISSGDDNPCVRSGVWQFIRIIGEKAATSVVLDRIILALEDVNPRVRASAWVAVGGIGKEVATRTILDHLIVALDDENPHVRSNAWQAVGYIGKEAVTGPVLDRLINAFGDESSDVKSSAWQAVGNMREKAARRAVLDRVLTALADESWHVRSSAWYAVAGIGKEAATSVVLDRLTIAVEDESQDVRSNAWVAVAALGEEAATRALLDRLAIALEDDNPHVRSSAWQAVGSMGENAVSATVLDHFVIALTDVSNYVTQVACIAVVSMGEKAATPEVVHGLVALMQNTESDRSGIFSDAFSRLLDAANIFPDANPFVFLLKRCLRCKEVWPIETIWLAGMILGYGLTFSGDRIYIYGDREPLPIDLSGLNRRKDLVKGFKEQKGKGLGVCPLNLPRSRKHTISISVRNLFSCTH